MVNGNEQTPVPLMHLACGFFQRQFMILNQLERSKRDRAERDDDLWLKNFYLAAKEARTVRDLRAGRLAIRPPRVARIAEDGVGDEDFFARQIDGGEEAGEVAPGLIAGQRPARAVAALSSGSFGDE